MADIFVLLTHPDETRGEEGLGMVFLEASAAGLPIVAGKSGGVEEAVLHNETGIVVDTYQTAQVVKNICELLLHPEYGRELGKRARERTQSDFVWAHQVAKLTPWLGPK